MTRQFIAHRKRKKRLKKLMPAPVQEPVAPVEKGGDG
jgi:hypothetical protein